MPIDKFGRHYHSTRYETHPHNVHMQVERMSDVYVETPLYIQGNRKDAVRYVDVNGSSEYTFPLRSGTVLRMITNAESVESTLNGKVVESLVGLLLRAGDILQFEVLRGKRQMLWVELVLKCSLGLGRKAVEDDH